MLYGSCAWCTTSEENVIRCYGFQIIDRFLYWGDLVPCFVTLVQRNGNEGSGNEIVNGAIIETRKAVRLKVAVSSPLLWTHAFTVLLQSLRTSSATVSQPAESIFPTLCRRPCSVRREFLQLQVWNQWRARHTGCPRGFDH